MFSLLKRYFMPYINGAGCTIDALCDEPDFPTSEAACNCDVAAGGISELYFLPCTETFSEANLLDLDKWTEWVGTQVEPGVLGRSGLGLGSVGKKTQKVEKVASCRTEQLTSITWALKFVIKCFDKTAARSTCAKMNELITKSQNYLLIARMCDGTDTILPVGKFNASDFDWVVPESDEDIQAATIELSWKELGFPCTVDVAGLSAILPKL